MWGTRKFLLIWSALLFGQKYRLCEGLRVLLLGIRLLGVFIAEISLEYYHHVRKSSRLRRLLRAGRELFHDPFDNVSRSGGSFSI